MDKTAEGDRNGRGAPVGLGSVLGKPKGSQNDGEANFGEVGFDVGAGSGRLQFSTRRCLIGWRQR